MNASDYEGMTVNERLFASGQLAAFERAVADTDERSARRILGSIDLIGADVEAVLQSHRVQTRAAA